MTAPPYPASGCTPIQWPGERTTARHELEPDNNIQNWFGSLVDDMRDASGQMYRRNRYYDPQTGQFTQPDPTGLDGGLNAYGFAEGDPVSYDDPYGLQCKRIDRLTGRVTEVPCEGPEPGIESVGLGPLEYTPGGGLVNSIRRGGRVLWKRAAATEVGEAVVSRFARWNFRRNLARQTGGTVAHAEAHHIFPHALRDEFAERQIDVNNPVFGAWWERASHRDQCTCLQPGVAKFFCQ